MQHKRHRTIKRLRKRYKHLAAIVAGAAILSGATLPGIPPSTAHAADPAPPNAPLTATQIPGDTNLGAPADYKQQLDIVATAYASGPHDNDQYGSKTFLGTQVRPGVVAVDPKVIPLGSRLYIQYPDGHGEYVVAEDTGGAIKGNRIDIVKGSVREAYDFGIQNVKVFVVDSPTQNA